MGMKSRRLKRIIRYLYGLLILACLLVIGTVLFFSAGFYLASPAAMPEKADAIIVLGGDGGARVARALEVFRQGYGRKVLIIRPQGKVALQQELRRSGARPEDIFFDSASKSTYEEAVNALRLIETRGWKHLLIVTDPPHMRRVGWTWRQVLKGSGVSFTLVATSAAWWDPEHWWRDQTARDFVVSEYKKLIYYVLMYGTGFTAEPQKIRPE